MSCNGGVDYNGNFLLEGRSYLYIFCYNDRIDDPIYVFLYYLYVIFSVIFLHTDLLIDSGGFENIQNNLVVRRFVR